jgi:hypothetical protein
MSANLLKQLIINVNYQIIISRQIQPFIPYPTITPNTLSNKTEETLIESATQEIRRKKVYVPQNIK